MIRILYVVATLVVLSGCAQFTTNATDQAALEAVAGKAGDDYVTCVINAAGRYQQTGESASLIAEVAKKGCTADRTAFIDAENASLTTRFMSTEPILQKQLAALDQRALMEVQQIQERALEQKVAAPSTAPSAASTAAIATADGSAYLRCMNAEGQRYAGVNEPATVVADVAHNRCSAVLTDAASAAALEKQGRALVMGLVLDRKVSRP
jgi:hypothetical protein